MDKTTVNNFSSDSFPVDKNRTAIKGQITLLDIRFFIFISTDYQLKWSAFTDVQYLYRIKSVFMDYTEHRTHTTPLIIVIFIYF